MSQYSDLPVLQWPTFGPELINLVEATTNKLDREWPLRYAQSGRAAVVFEMIARVQGNTFRTIRALSLDAPQWPLQREDVLSVTPLVRGMLDALFTTILLLQDVPAQAIRFTRAGWRENAEEFARHEALYSTEPQWESWLNEFRLYLKGAAASDGITTDEAANLKRLPYWPIPSQMLGDSALSPEAQALLRYLNDWFYKNLSAHVHLSWPGLVMRSAALLKYGDDIERTERLDKQRSDQVLMASLIALAFASEIEIHFQFGLGPRLLYVWGILIGYFGMARELYEPWYRSRLEPTGGRRDR